MLDFDELDDWFSLSGLLFCLSDLLEGGSEGVHWTDTACPLALIGAVERAGYCEVAPDEGDDGGYYRLTAKGRRKLRSMATLQGWLTDELAREEADHAEQVSAQTVP